MARLKLFIPLIIFALMAAIFFMMLSREDYNPQDLPSALIDQTLPAFDLPLLQGDQRITDRDIIGEPMLLNVWATWCVSCRVEHPFLNQLSQQGVKIIGLDYKDERSKALDWLAKLGNPYALNVFDAEGKLGLDLGVYGAPETYLIDSRGVIRYKHVGVIDERVWREELQPRYEELQPRYEELQPRNEAPQLK